MYLKWDGAISDMHGARHPYLHQTMIMLMNISSRITVHNHKYPCLFLICPTNEYMAHEWRNMDREVSSTAFLFFVVSQLDRQ